MISFCYPKNMKEGENALILFERISYLLSDLCHFVAALNGERISVGFHIIEEHERPCSGVHLL
mgnify:CR=1 FL=1